MTRRRTLTTVTVMCLALLAGAFAQAAEDLLEVIPQQSLGFVVVNRLAETDAKIQAMGRQVQLPVPSLLGMLKARVGLEGVLDEKGAAAIALMPAADAAAVGPRQTGPAAVAFLPVTDYGKLLRQLKADDASAKIVEVKVGGQAFLVGRRGGYAVMAKPGDRDALEKALGSTKGVAGDLGSLRGMLAEGDVAAVVTRRGVEVLSIKGQAALRQAKESLAAIPDIEKQGLELAVSVFGVYEKILKCLGDEINSYAVAGRIDDAGNLHLTERVRLTSGGQAAKMLSQVEPPRRDLLAGLPDGPFVFVLSGALPQTMGEGLMKFSAEMMKAAPGLYGFTDEQVDRLIEISGQSMKGLRGISMMMGVGKPGDPIYGNITVVERVDDSKAFLADYKKTIQAMNQLIKESESSIMTASKLKDVEIGGVSALRLTMKIPMAPQMVNVPDFDEIMEKMFGPGGKMVVFMAPADKHTIVAAYTGKKLLQECLEVAQGTKPGLAADPDVAKTAAMLPAGAQWVGYISPKGTIDFIKRVIPVFTPEGIDAPELPEFPQTPPIGFGVKTTPDGVQSQTVVPAAVIKGIAGFVGEIMKKRAAVQEVEAVEVPDR